MKYDKKFPKVGNTRPLDCVHVLKDFLPPPAFEGTFEADLQTDTTARGWTPPGEKIHTYSRQGRTFEIWAGYLSEVNVRFLLDQIQIFILFFIEGGQFINLDDPEWTLDRWRIYFVYEKTEPPSHSTVSPYVLTGYATTYRFYRFTPPSQQQTKASLTSFPNVESVSLSRQDCRFRIAQFVILPPFQSSGHGSELYRTIYREAMADTTVSELTVEDPSEEFDKLRDANDWKILEPAFRTAEIKINAAAVAGQARFKRMPKKKLLDIPLLERIRKENKIAPRQFYRLMELYLLAQIPYSHRAAGGASLTKLLIKKHKSTDPVDVKYYWLRNLIKQRIWWKNNDKFTEISASEIVDQINDVTRGQEDEYEGLLLSFAAKKAVEEDRNGHGAGPSEAAAPRKRKIIDDDDDDDAAMSDASKKARV